MIVGTELNQHSTIHYQPRTPNPDALANSGMPPELWLRMFVLLRVGPNLGQNVHSQKSIFYFLKLINTLVSSPFELSNVFNENGFARAFGGDGGTCVCRGKVTTRLSPCFAGRRILLSSLFGAKIR
jgi:hypothetical protein